MRLKQTIAEMLEKYDDSIIREVQFYTNEADRNKCTDDYLNGLTYIEWLESLDNSGAYKYFHDFVAAYKETGVMVYTHDLLCGYPVSEDDAIIANQLIREYGYKKVTFELARQLKVRIK